MHVACSASAGPRLAAAQPCRRIQGPRFALPSARNLAGPLNTPGSQLLASRTPLQPNLRRRVLARAEGGGGGPKPEFGYSRKDVVLIGGGLIGLGYALYYGLQAAGVDAGIAGNWVQLIIFLGICVGWIGSYLYRVATKNMTYVKQLEDYEEAVMRKRLEEMPESEVEGLLEEIERKKEEVAAKRAARQAGGDGPPAQ